LWRLSVDTFRSLFTVAVTIVPSSSVLSRFTIQPKIVDGLKMLLGKLSSTREFGSVPRDPTETGKQKNTAEQLHTTQTVEQDSFGWFSAKLHEKRNRL
jgi:hypothetical protein